jgi:hypothetical protein
MPKGGRQVESGQKQKWRPSAESRRTATCCGKRMGWDGLMLGPEFEAKPFPTSLTRRGCDCNLKDEPGSILTEFHLKRLTQCRLENAESKVASQFDQNKRAD